MSTIEDFIRDKQTMLIDVRNAEELAEDGSIDHARHIPLPEILDYIEDLRKDTAPKVVFCRSGQRAEYAKQLLKSAGVENVFNGMGYTDIKRLLS